MKKFLIILFIFNIFLINTSFGYEYFENLNGYTGKIFKIEKNDDYKIIVSTSKTGDSLETLVKNKGGVGGINGAYFCPKDYSECNGVNSIHGDRISDGKISSKWKNTGARYIFGFTKNNEVIIHKSPNIQPDNFDGIYNGISNFPLILKDGNSSLKEFSSLIDKKMKLKGPKNFICSTKTGDIYMGYINNQTIYTMVDVLKKIGCYNALNLDSGGSLGVYNNGYKKTPSREIMDAFVIVSKNGKKIIYPKNIVNNLEKSELKGENLKIKDKINEQSKLGEIRELEEQKNKVEQEKNRKIKKQNILEEHKKILKQKNKVEQEKKHIEENILKYKKIKNLEEAKKIIKQKVLEKQKLEKVKKFEKEKLKNKKIKNNIKEILYNKNKEKNGSEKRDLINKKLTSRRFLYKDKKIENFILKIDKKIEKMDKTKLKKIHEKISILSVKMKINKKNNFSGNLVKYLEAKILLKLKGYE